MKVRVGQIYRLRREIRQTAAYPEYIWIIAKHKEHKPPLVDFFALGRKYMVRYLYESSIRSIYRIYNADQSRNIV